MKAEIKIIKMSTIGWLVGWLGFIEWFECHIRMPRLPGSSRHSECRHTECPMQKCQKPTCKCSLPGLSAFKETFESLRMPMSSSDFSEVFEVSERECLVTIKCRHSEFPNTNTPSARHSKCRSRRIARSECAGVLESERECQTGAKGAFERSEATMHPTPCHISVSQFARPSSQCLRMWV